MFEDLHLKQIQELPFVEQKAVYMKLFTESLRTNDPMLAAGCLLALHEISEFLKLPFAVTFAWKTECRAKQIENNEKLKALLGL